MKSVSLIIDGKKVTASEGETVLWAALEWYRTGGQRLLVALFFFYALSFGNHLTMITLLPALILLILAKDAKVILRWQNWIWALLAIVAGVLQYGLLLWRSYNPHPALLPRFPLRAGVGELRHAVQLCEVGLARGLAPGRVDADVPSHQPPRPEALHGIDNAVRADQLQLALVRQVADQLDHAASSAQAAEVQQPRHALADGEAVEVLRGLRGGDLGEFLRLP